MLNLTERTIRTQRENLKSAHNERYTQDGNEFRLLYEGGLGEAFSIVVRRVGERDFKTCGGFSAYKLYTKEQVINYAKALTAQSEEI